MLFRSKSTGSSVRPIDRAQDMKTYLTVPSVCEEKEMEPVENDVEDEPARCEELTPKPVFCHACSVRVLHVLAAISRASKLSGIYTR